MSNTTLREYYQEVETLVAQGRLDEVVAHCRHILKYFPKDVSVYRLLGKSYLESRRLSDATDILQRVLSVIPDDFVSHVGMSLVREDEGNLGAAIWHMERAFEIQPSNSAIRDEVRRLFGKRDGMEPPKIRLTRGALARMYANGNLYQQSISELNSALSEEPQRFDLLVLLARMYYLNGQHVDSAEVCNTLINKLPFCLDANRILAAVLVNSGRESEADVYTERLQVLDPYTPFAPAGSLDSDGAEDASVTLPHLEWEPGQEIPGTDSHPSWASSLGIDIGDSVSDDDDVPVWLQDEDETVKPADQQSEITPMDIIASDAIADEFIEDEITPSAGASEVESTLPAADEEAEDLIPDWMKDSGWATAGDASEVDNETEFTTGDSGELAGSGVNATENSEMPSWLKDMAPDSLDSSPEEIDLAEEDMSGEIPGWLSSQAPGSTDSVVMWLKDQPDQENLPKTGPLPSIDPETGDEIPDWLDSVVSSMENSGAADADEQSEQRDEESVGRGLVAAAGAAAAAAETSDWLKDEEADSPINPEEDTRPRGTGELVPPAMAAAESIEEMPPAVEPPAEPVESGDLDVESEFSAEPDETSGIDWDLDSISDEMDASAVGGEDAEIPEWLTESVSDEIEISFDEAGEIAPLDEEAVPEWLSDMEREATGLSGDIEVKSPVSEIGESFDSSSADVPSWNAEAGQDDEGEVASNEVFDPVSGFAVRADAEVDDLEQTPDELPSEDDQDAALAWLEGLAKKQGVDEEELVTSPDERVDAPPDWVSETVQDFEAAEATPPTTASGEEAAEPDPAEWVIDTIDSEEGDEEKPPWEEETLVSFSKTEKIPESAELPDWAAETMPKASDEGEDPAWETETMVPEEDAPEWATETMATTEEDDLPLDSAAETQASLPKATGDLQNEAFQEKFESLEPSEDKDWMRETQIPQADFLEESTEPEDAPSFDGGGEPSAAEAHPGEPSDWMVETALPDMDSLSDDQPIELTPEMSSEEDEPESPPESQPEAEWMLDTNIPSAAGFKEAEDTDESTEETENIGAGLAAAVAGLAAAGFTQEDTSEEGSTDDQPEWMVETALPDMSTIDDLAEDAFPPDEIPQIEAIEAEEKTAPKPEIVVEAAGEEVGAVEPESAAVPVVDRFSIMLSDAQTSLAGGDVQNAVEIYRKLIRRKKNLPQIISDLKEAVYRYPVDTNILESLADAYSGSDRLQDALDAYTKTEELLRK